MPRDSLGHRSGFQGLAVCRADAHNGTFMKPDKPPPNNPAQRPTRGFGNDFLLDPLPVPEALESDSDTAWGLWELSLQGDTPSAETSTQPADFEQMTEPQDLQGSTSRYSALEVSADEAEPDKDFQSTVPASLEDLERLLKR